MSSFLYGLARSAYRRRVLVLLVWLAATVVIGGFAGLAGDKFEENFSLPGTESQTALDQLKRTFPQSVGTSAQVVIVAPEGKSVRDSDIKSADHRQRQGIREDRARSTASPFPTTSTSRT